MMYFLIFVSINVMFYDVFCDVQYAYINIIGYICDVRYLFSSFYLTIINYFTNFILFFTFHDIYNVRVVYI